MQSEKLAVFPKWVLVGGFFCFLFGAPSHFFFFLGAFLEFAYECDFFFFWHTPIGGPRQVFKAHSILPKVKLTFCWGKVFFCLGFFFFGLIFFFFFSLGPLSYAPFKRFRWPFGVFGFIIGFFFFLKKGKVFNIEKNKTG